MNHNKKRLGRRPERIGFRNGARVTRRPFASIERVNGIASYIKAAAVLRVPPLRRAA